MSRGHDQNDDDQAQEHRQTLPLPLAPTPTALTLSAASVLAQRGITLPPTLDGSGIPGAAPTPGTGAIPVGRFRFINEIGRGGMGRIVEAWDPELRRTVALKVVIDPKTVRPSRWRASWPRPRSRAS